MFFTEHFFIFFRIFLVCQGNIFEPFTRVFFHKNVEIKKGPVQNKPCRLCINFYIKSFFQEVLTRLLFPCENLFNEW